MNLAQLSIKDYSASLASSAPAPGGGAATALTACQGGSLLAMVCNLSIGKEKFKEHEDLLKELLQKATELQEEAQDLMDRDAESFGEVGKVFQMPRDTDEEKAQRKAAMETALKGCTAPPMALMELSVQGLVWTEEALGKTTEHAVSDLGVAALFFKSALEGAWLNVCINLGSIADENFGSTHSTRGKALLEEGKAKADAIYGQVLTGILHHN